MANYLTDQHGKVIESTRPLPVRDVGVSHEREAISAETVTFTTGAAGFSQVVALDKGPVANHRGDKVGSFWRQQKNLVLASGPRGDNAISQVTAVVETAAAATITITDAQYNLEQLFEHSPATRQPFIVVVRDTSGDELYGWIGAIAATGNSYVMNVQDVDNAQSWVGDLAAFTFAANTTTYEIYSYESSLAWVTGAILTREVAYQEGGSELEMLDAMANGDYAIDYQRGRILYKKATTGTTDTCNYSVLKNYVTLDSDIEIGAVELKDAATTARAIINAANTARAATNEVLLTQVLDEDGVVVGGSPGPEAPQAQGTDAAGTDAYAIVVTASARRTHILCSLGGAFAAIVSLDSGATDHIYVPANSIVTLDDIVIANAATVQGRNAVGGSNYTDLFITIW